MLGAHARAAEYNAAKKAQARQASREAEEQKVPPPAAPISLGAFTRPVTSRNKGTKTYVPLVLESTPEADHEASKDDVAETPTKKPGTPSSRQSSARLAQLGHHSNGAHPPTAPRSMVPREYVDSMMQPAHPYAQRPHSMPAFHDTPPHMAPPFLFPPNYPYHQLAPPPQMLPPPHYAWPAQLPFPDQAIPFPPPPFHPQPQRNIFDSPVPAQRRIAPMPTDSQLRRSVPIRQSSEEPPQHRPQGLLPGQVESRPQALLEALSRAAIKESGQDSPQGHPQEPKQLATPEEQPRRYVFGPDDLSPCKQEVKNTARARMLRENDKADRQSADLQPAVPNPIRMRNSTLLGPGSNASEDHLDCITPTARSATKTQLQLLSHATPAYQDSLPNPLRQYSESNTDDLVEPVTAVPWMKSGNIPDRVLVARDEGPYDREAKMQKFVAVQAERNKQGKTVLSHPERKETASVASQVPSVAIGNGGPGPALSEEQIRNLPQVTQQASRTPIKPPPGLEKPEHPFVPPLDEEEEQSQADAELREQFGVGSSDWFDLKAPTLFERKKMQSTMKYVRQKNANREPRRVGDNGRWYTESRVEKLVSEDPRPFPGGRQRISDMAEDYSSRLHAAVGQPKPSEREIDIYAGMVRGAGNILANLNQTLDDSREKRDYFHRVKEVPASAIDWEVLATGVSSLTMFDERTTENKKHPVRFLRDPRYAHLSRESPKSMSGDSGLYKTVYGWGK